MLLQTPSLPFSQSSWMESALSSGRKKFIPMGHLCKTPLLAFRLKSINHPLPPLISLSHDSTSSSLRISKPVFLCFIFISKNSLSQVLISYFLCLRSNVSWFTPNIIDLLVQCYIPSLYLHFSLSFHPRAEFISIINNPGK